MGTQFNYEQISEFANDNKYYCWSHKKNVINNNKKKKADKVKEEKLKLKEKQKEEKLLAKQKEKEEKVKLKEELKKSVQLAKMNKKSKIIIKDEKNENIIIGVSSVEEPILLCQEILKSGKNKGTVCGDKIFENNLCKRHHNKKML